jgi:hypothetical protein
MTKKRIRRLGSATLEFTLVGIPLIFVLISIVEMARGMWTYHSLAYAVKEGARYAVVHGQNAGLETPSDHGTVQRVCNTIVQSAPGLLSQSLVLTFESGYSGGTFANVKGPYCAGGTCAGGYSACPTDIWPPNAGIATDDQPGQLIRISGYYPFVSALSMFWPGAGKGVNFTQLTCSGAGTLCLPAASADVMQY